MAAVRRQHHALRDSKVIIIVERNLGFEAEHLFRYCRSIPESGFLREKGNTRIGILTTQTMKMAYVSFLNILLREERACCVCRRRTLSTVEKPDAQPAARPALVFWLFVFAPRESVSEAALRHRWQEPTWPWRCSLGCILRTTAMACGLAQRFMPAARPALVFGYSFSRPENQFQKQRFAIGGKTGGGKDDGHGAAVWVVFCERRTLWRAVLAFFKDSCLLLDQLSFFGYNHFHLKCHNFLNHKQVKARAQKVSFKINPVSFARKSTKRPVVFQVF